MEGKCNRRDESQLEALWQRTINNTCVDGRKESVYPFIELADMTNKAISPGTTCQNSNSCSDSETCSSCELHGKTKCLDVDNRNAQEIQEKSTCPWYYVYTIDKDRYPKKLAEAKGIDCDPPDWDCAPIWHYIPVLVKTDESDTEGYCNYDMKMYPLRVGFTSVIPRVTNNGPK